VPVRDAKVEWATEPGKPTTITFAPVRSDRIRLELTSSAPGTAQGFLGVSEATVGR
jgi:beta-galactosidase